jgi:hypothetical protein
MTDAGPIVVELPPGPILAVVDDADVPLVANMGLVGAEAGDALDGARSYELRVPAPMPASDGSRRPSDVTAI